MSIDGRKALSFRLASSGFLHLLFPFACLLFPPLNAAVLLSLFPPRSTRGPIVPNPRTGIQSQSSTFLNPFPPGSSLSVRVASSSCPSAAVVSQTHTFFVVLGDKKTPPPLLSSPPYPGELDRCPQPTITYLLLGNPSNNHLASIPSSAIHISSQSPSISSTRLHRQLPIARTTSTQSSLTDPSTLDYCTELVRAWPVSPVCHQSVAVPVPVPLSWVDSKPSLGSSFY
ncbi:hypothetical protein B0T20DRAFT_45765 [Sordaria brevicollis]|uniref:Uncharacterized protein n=1 Tax=Sordaria brevicollis TaxID=83679 RepID=A0AAE0P9G9_SORBR|nr:hypothetical protein B0T20DRAFT_45765 [Sordaria brevicollis]